jgi:hypothetical protein
MITKLTFTISLFLFGLNSYSQIDTAIIFSEIRELKTDEMIDEYWRKLEACDQNLHTFNNPVLQTENLLKVIYFYKYFGFSKYCFYDKTKLNYNNSELYSRTIWMHQPYSDLSYYTYPLIIECGKLVVDTHEGYSSYYIQGVTTSGKNEGEYGKIAYDKIKNNKFDDINIDTISMLAFEFMNIYRNSNNSAVDVGQWRGYKNYKTSIFKTDSGDYYFKDFGYFKLKKISNNIYEFEIDRDGTYLEIDENGNLLNKDGNGKILKVYNKVLFEY